MSSKTTRDTITTHINTFLSTLPEVEKLVDLSGEFANLEDLLDYYEVGHNKPWIGLQFLGSDISVTSITGQENNLGCFREDGAILLHIVDIGKLGGHNDIIARGEALGNSIRGRRLPNGVVVEAVSPVNFGRGVALQFEGTYVSGTMTLDYYRDYTNN